MSSIGHVLTQIVNAHHGNVTPVLGLWILMGLVGAIITVFNLKDAIQDTDALVELPAVISRERRRELVSIARASIRTEAIRLIKMLVIISTGLVAADSAPTLSDAQRQALHIPYWTPTGVAIVVGLLSIVSLIVLQAVLDRRLRHTFYKRGNEQQDGRKVNTITIAVPDSKEGDTNE